MNVAKLSLSTRMAIPNNFGFPKGENGTIGAIVMVSKNIDKELTNLGASIQGIMQGQKTGKIFTIRFPIKSLDKISEIDGLVYLDIGEKANSIMPQKPIDMNLLNKQYQDALNEQNAINQQNNLTSSTNVAPETSLQKNKNNLLIIGVLVLGYFAYKKYKK